MDIVFELEKNVTEMTGELFFLITRPKPKYIFETVF